METGTHNNGDNSRRRFIQQTTAAGIGLMLAPKAALATPNQQTGTNPDSQDNPLNTRRLGKLKVSALGARMHEHQCKLWRLG